MVTKDRFGVNPGLGAEALSGVHLESPRSVEELLSSSCDGGGGSGDGGGGSGDGAGGVCPAQVPCGL